MTVRTVPERMQSKREHPEVEEENLESAFVLDLMRLHRCCSCKTELSEFNFCRTFFKSFFISQQVLCRPTDHHLCTTQTDASKVWCMLGKSSEHDMTQLGNVSLFCWYNHYKARLVFDVAVHFFFFFVPQTLSNVRGVSSFFRVENFNLFYILWSSFSFVCSWKYNLRWKMFRDVKANTRFYFTF